MTTTTIPRKPRSRPAPAPVGLLAALADIPRERVTVYVVALFLEVMLLVGMGVL